MQINKFPKIQGVSEKKPKNNPDLLGRDFQGELVIFMQQNMNFYHCVIQLVLRSEETYNFILIRTPDSIRYFWLLYCI